MNPDSAVRPWLLTVGKQFGIRVAENYIWPDASTKPREPYFTYRVLSGQPVEGNVKKSGDKDGYTVIWAGWQSQETKVEIKLHREMNGVQILTQCAIAAMACEPIKRHFDKSGCRLKGIDESVEDQTPPELDMTNGDYKDQIVQRMVVTFNDNVSVEIREENGVVDTLEMDLGLI
jgi:hypothetical protein